MEDQELDMSVLETEAAKAAGEGIDDASAEESATSKETKEEETSKEDTSADSLKPEEKSEEEEAEVPFHKHPRWQQQLEKEKQLQQQRDEFQTKNEDYERELSELRSLKEKIQDMNPDELVNLKNAANLLRKNPELAEKVRKIISEHPYEKEEINTALKTIETRQADIENKLALKEYDETVEKLFTSHKVDKDDKDMVKEILDNRVVNQKLNMKDLSKAVEQVVKDVEKFRRKTIASHIETRSKETRVPVSPAQKGKMIATKKESAEQGDIIDELANGLKNAHAQFEES